VVVASDHDKSCELAEKLVQTHITDFIFLTPDSALILHLDQFMGFFLFFLNRILEKTLLAFDGTAVWHHQSFVISFETLVDGGQSDCLVIVECGLGLVG